MRNMMPSENMMPSDNMRSSGNMIPSDNMRSSGNMMPSDNMRSSGNMMPSDENMMPLNNIVGQQGMRNAINNTTGDLNHANNMNQRYGMNYSNMNSENMIGWPNSLYIPGAMGQMTNLPEDVLFSQYALAANASGGQSSSNRNQRKQAALQLAQACFAVHEAVLYLDTHPTDPNALDYYNKKKQQREAARTVYERTVGPITSDAVDTSSGSWAWVETPWPWQLKED